MHITTKLPYPKNCTQWVLHTLLNKGSLTESESGLNGYRSRLSELRNDYGIPIQARKIKFTTRFNKPKDVNEHFILESYFDTAIAAYLKMWNGEKN